MQLSKVDLLLDTVLGGKALFIPTKAAQWCYVAKKSSTSQLKIPRSPTELANFQLSARQT